MSWRDFKENNDQKTLEAVDDVDQLNDETFGDDISSGGDWESHHFSSVLLEEDRVKKAQEATTSLNEGNNNSSDISQFEKLGLKDLWESSVDPPSSMGSIWSPSALPQHPSPSVVVDKSNSPVHSSSSSGSGTKKVAINAVNVQDLEKSMIEVDDSSSSHSPSHSPSPNVLPASFRHLHSSPSPSPPPPNTSFYPRPPHPLMVPHMRPPPGFPIIGPHPHQQRFLPPTMRMPPYLIQGPPPHLAGHRVPYLPPNVPLMGPPKIIGFPQPRPPLVVHPPHMSPVHVRHEMPRNVRPHPHQSSHQAPSKLSEMLYDLKPDGSGFMTKKEKEWVIKVQLIQLHSANPEIDDYYYQKFIQRFDKTSKEEGVVDSTGGTKLTPLTLPPPVAASNRSQRTSSGFEGSLGKVSVGSAAAPRRIIDALTHAPSPSAAEVTVNRKKQALITIEQMYTLLLELEELQSIVTDKKATESQQELMDALNEQLLTLLLGDTPYDKENNGFQVLMSYPKGKRLFGRVLPLLNENKSKTAVLCFSKNIYSVLKKDVNDKLLPHLLPAIKAVIVICEMTEIQQLLRLLQPILSSKYVANEFFVSYVTSLVNQGYRISSKLSQPTGDWSSLITAMGQLLRQSKTKSDALLKLLATPTS